MRTDQNMFDVRHSFSQGNHEINQSVRQRVRGLPTALQTTLFADDLFSPPRPVTPAGQEKGDAIGKQGQHLARCVAGATSLVLSTTSPKDNAIGCPG